MDKSYFALGLVLVIAGGCAKDSGSLASPTGGLASAGSSAKGASASGAFTFTRTYKLGDKDTYNVKMEQSTGKVDMSMTMTQEVTKVYDNGDADIKETSTDVVMNMGGKKITSPPTPAITLKLDKNGAPVGGTTGSMSGGFGEQLSRITGGITVGQTVPYDYSNPAMPGSHDVGKITYVSADGPSKFHISSDVTDAKGGKTHMDGDISLDNVSKKPISADMTMTSTGQRANTTHLVMTLKNP